MDKLWCPKCKLPYRASTFLTSEERTPHYNEYSPNVSVMQKFY